MNKLVIFVCLGLIVQQAMCQHPVGETVNDSDDNEEKIISYSTDFENELKFLNISLSEKEIEKYLPKRYKQFFDYRKTNIVNYFQTAAESGGGLYLPRNSNSSQCHAALRRLSYPWNFLFTIRMIDSWGKIPDGLFIGNVMPFGMYDECLLLKNNATTERGQLRGRYCYISLIPKHEEVTTGDLNTLLQEPDPHIGNIFGFLDQGAAVSYGTCIPSDCTEKDMREHIDTTMTSMKLLFVSCDSLDDEKDPLTGGDISLIVFLCILTVVILISTFLDLYSDQEGKAHLKQGHNKSLLAFSLHTNVRKLFNVTSAHQKGTITCLHGLRAFSMIWVVYGHQYALTLMTSMNVLDIPRKTRGLLFQAIGNATFSVDTFFFLSGLLVAYLGLKSIRKNGDKLSLPVFYIHRYLRLTPAIAMTAWFKATLSRYTIHGPYESRYGPVVEKCQRNWWVDLLYINNYVRDGQDCILQGWYLATDTQIYIFMPLVLIPLYHSRLWGKLWLGFLILASCLLTSILTLVYDFSPFTEPFNWDMEKNAQYMKIIYANPAARAGAYLVGIAIGYIIYEQGNKRLKLKQWQVAVGWAVSTVVALAILFGMWPYNVYYLLPSNQVDKAQYNAATQFFYGGFSRTLWAACMGWIVIACHYGYGGPVNGFLSHPSFQPLSRLTYCMYLLSIQIQMILLYNQKQPTYFSHLNEITETCGSLFLIGLSAVLLTLLVESPIINLEKVFLQKSKGSTPVSQHHQNTSTNIPKVVLVSPEENGMLQLKGHVGTGTSTSLDQVQRRHNDSKDTGIAADQVQDRYNDSKDTGTLADQVQQQYTTPSVTGVPFLGGGVGTTDPQSGTDEIDQRYQQWS